MNEPVPDPSRPMPSLGDVFRAFTPAGTDPDALVKALKASEMPSVSSRQLSDAITSTSGMTWCQRCGRPEPKNGGCPNKVYDQVSFVPIGKELPADPFTPGEIAAAAAMDIYEDLLAAGMPLGSVENIIGKALAELIRDAPTQDGSDHD